MFTFCGKWSITLLFLEIANARRHYNRKLKNYCLFYWLRNRHIKLVSQRKHKSCYNRKLRVMKWIPFWYAVPWRQHGEYHLVFQICVEGEICTGLEVMEKVWTMCMEKTIFILKLPPLWHELNTKMWVSTVVLFIFEQNSVIFNKLISKNRDSKSLRLGCSSVVGSVHSMHKTLV